MIYIHANRSTLRFLIVSIVISLCSLSCMRIEPTHPYDADSPPQYRAPASLLSALFSNEIPQGFDYSNFTVQLEATEFEGRYSQRPDSDGRFSFQGVPPGIYNLSTEGYVDGVLYGFDTTEIFLAVGEKVTPPFFDIAPLDR